MFKTNTIVKKWFTHKTIKHISIARTDQKQTLKMLRTYKEIARTDQKQTQKTREDNEKDKTTQYTHKDQTR